MLTLEQYAAAYLAMVTAAGNTDQEEAICKQHNITVAQWKEAQAFYTSKMMDPNDGGKTAMAFSAAVMSNATNPQSVTTQGNSNKPSGFEAGKVSIYKSEFDVEMIEFLSTTSKQHLVIQMVTEADDAQKGFGGDQPHLSFNEQRYSIYGGLSKLLLNRNEAEFIFDEEGRERMQCDRLTITFSIDENQYGLLLRKMKWIFGDVLELAAGANRLEQHVNGLIYSEEMKTFDADDSLKVDIRHNMEHVKNTGKYNFVLFVDYNYNSEKNMQEQQLQQRKLMNKLIPMYEQDQSAYFAFATHTNKQSRLYIYLSIDPDRAISRLNTALYRMPELPLGLGGGEDASWANYTNCLNDYQMLKN